MHLFPFKVSNKQSGTPTPPRNDLKSLKGKHGFWLKHVTAKEDMRSKVTVADVELFLSIAVPPLP